MKKLFIVLFFFVFFVPSYGQNDSLVSVDSAPKKKVYIGIEGGFAIYSSSFNDYDFIREESFYYSDYRRDYSGTTSSTINLFAKLKIEYRASSDRLWLSSGINYSNISFEHDESEYVYVMLSQNNANTYYYRVNKFAETNRYLGVPLDIRYSPFLPRFFRLYFKLTFDFNFSINSTREIQFYDSAMEKYQSEVLDLFDGPKNFYSSGSLGAGIQLGKQDKLNVRFEASLPAFMLTPKAFGFMTAKSGGGLSISVLLPSSN